PWQRSLAPGTLPDRASEQSSISAVLEAHLAPGKQGFQLDGAVLPPLPRGASLPCWLCTRRSGGVAGLLQQVLPQGLLP
ncbi:hypothetical protein, partial [Cutibacterium acnes]|uniref:hypothetical protein n=1 Tax=Cutibacterium acnes TaxID=1747 RepID=UPI001BE49B17